MCVSPRLRGRGRDKSLQLSETRARARESKSKSNKGYFLFSRVVSSLLMTNGWSLVAVAHTHTGLAERRAHPQCAALKKEA